MTILKVTYGNPVASIKGICEHYQISDRTARMIVKELEQERGRYGDYALEGISGHLSRLTSCIGSSGAFYIAGDVLLDKE